MQIHEYLNGDNAGNPGIRSGVKEQVRHLANVLDPLWVGTESRAEAAGWIYFGNEKGVHRRYPGGDQVFFLVFKLLLLFIFF